GGACRPASPMPHVLQDALTHVSHALRNAAPDGLSSLGFVNEAGWFFFGCRRWRFAEKQVQQIRLGNGARSYPLPLGAELLSLTPAFNIAAVCFTRLELEDLAGARALYSGNAVQAGQVYYSVVSALSGEDVQTQTPQSMLSFHQPIAGPLDALLAFRQG